MLFPPIGNFGREAWDSYGSQIHPQSKILRQHIDRAVQDLFLETLRRQDDDFLFIFSDENQIEKFCQGMIKYWEEKEEYETCAEILKLEKEIISRWKSIIKEDPEGENEIKQWFNSSI